MRHYSEDTIELYLLGAPDVQPIRAEIGEHLTGCAGCREIHAELSAIYGEAGACRAESGRKAAEIYEWGLRGDVPALRFAHPCTCRGRGR